MPLRKNLKRKRRKKRSSSTRHIIAAGILLALILFFESFVSSALPTCFPVSVTVMLFAFVLGFLIMLSIAVRWRNRILKIVKAAGWDGMNEAIDSFDMRFRLEYQHVLNHRDNCPKWKKQELCVDCFGGGLSAFFKRVRGKHAS